MLSLFLSAGVCAARLCVLYFCIAVFCSRIFLICLFLICRRLIQLGSRTSRCHFHAECRNRQEFKVLAEATHIQGAGIGSQLHAGQIHRCL